MAPNSDESKKNNQITAKGTTTATRTDARPATAATYKSGAVAIAAQSGASPLNKTGIAVATAPTKARTATAAPNSGVAVTSAQPRATPLTKTGGAAAPSNKNATSNSINNTGQEPDWEAIRAEEAHKKPNIKTEQVTGIIAWLDLFIRNQDESKPTIHRACPRNKP